MQTPLQRFLPLVASLAWVIPAASPGQPAVYTKIPAHETLTDRQWQRVDQAIDRGFEYLLANQQRDGSFASVIGGQPGVTSLGVMAFLSRGHRPGEGPHGKALNRAIDFVIGCQEPSGLLARDHHEYGEMVWLRRPHTATYNHAISGLMLGEAYGHGSAELDGRLKPVIEKALVWSRKMQRRPPRYPEDVGGWRYLHPGEPGKPLSDLSATGWFVMFYRSARNAEFEVPEDYVDSAAGYAQNCFDPRTGGFFYGAHRQDHTVSRGMTGAGLLVMTVAGRRDEKIARRAAGWLLNHPFDRYRQNVGGHDRFHYGAYYCSQAMYLLGGEYWARFYPKLADTMLNGQQADGGWLPETTYGDGRFGRSYTTAMAVLSLTPPYQMLPIYQR